MTVEEKVIQLFQQRRAEIHGNHEFKYTEYRHGRQIKIQISSMYSLGGFVSFEFMSRLADLLGTRKLDLKDEYYECGCDTCDFGSSYSVTLVCSGLPHSTWDDQKWV